MTMDFRTVEDDFLQVYQRGERSCSRLRDVLIPLLENTPLAGRIEAAKQDPLELLEVTIIWIEASAQAKDKVAGIIAQHFAEVGRQIEELNKQIDAYEAILSSQRVMIDQLMSKIRE